MRNTLLKILYLFLSVATLSLSACSDKDSEADAVATNVVEVVFSPSGFGSDDEPDNPTPEPSKATEFFSTLSMTASQDLLEVANVTVYYIDSNGQVASEPMGSTEWTKTITQKLPCKYGFAFACSKKQGVTIDESKTYTFNEVLTRSFEVHDQNGKVISGSNKELKIKDEVIGEGVETFISALSFSYEFDVDEDGKQTATTIDWGFNAGGGGTTNTPVDDEPATGDAE